MRIKSVVPVALLLAAFSVSFSGAALAQKPESEGGKQYDKKHDKKHDNQGDKKSDKAADNKHGRADEKRLDVQGAGESAHSGERLHLLAPLVREDRDHIRQYLLTGDAGFSGQPGQGKHKPLPPGLQQKLDRGGDLPPGWQKKVARGEVLEPDLRRRAQRLPADLNRGLQGYGADTELLLLEDRVLRVATGQGTVLDVIDIADILVR